MQVRALLVLRSSAMAAFRASQVMYSGETDRCMQVKCLGNPCMQVRVLHLACLVLFFRGHVLLENRRAVMPRSYIFATNSHVGHPALAQD